MQDNPPRREIAPLISAGTGLGEAGLLAEEKGYRPFHRQGIPRPNFGPRNELEIEAYRVNLMSPL